MKPVKDPDEDMILEDSDNYFHSSAGSRKEILLKMFERTCLEGSKEMTESGITRRVIRGQVYDIPRPDQKSVFNNSVDILARMLNSDIKNNEKIKDRIKSLDDKQKEIFEKINTYREEELTRAEKRLSKNKIDPYNRDFCSRMRNDVLNEREKKRQNYYYQKHKELLVILENLLSELNYLEEGSAA